WSAWGLCSIGHLKGCSISVGLVEHRCIERPMRVQQEDNYCYMLWMNRCAVLKLKASLPNMKTGNLSVLFSMIMALAEGSLPRTFRRMKLRLSQLMRLLWQQAVRELFSANRLTR